MDVTYFSVMRFDIRFSHEFPVNMVLYLLAQSV